MPREVSRIWMFHFFTVAFLSVAVGGLPTTDSNGKKNITLSVPADTFDNGDPNLLCTPTKWLDILVFFLANYFAHAATVKSLPGERLKDFAFAVFLAISFPFSGISRGLDAILRRASFSSNDLEKAARAGALCIVVRNKDWVKSPKLPTGQKLGAASAKNKTTEFSKGKIKLEYVSYRNVHGLSELPEGYNLAKLPSNAKVVPNVTSDTGPNNKEEKIVLSSPHSIVQVLVAIFQVIYASYTLYRTRGEQINQYGYAAFGLTVIPYLVMSFTNLLGNLLTPNYPTLFLVDSPELQEAKSTPRSGRFDGFVGTVIVSEDSEHRFEGRKFSNARPGSFDECSSFEIVGRQSRQGPGRLGFLWWGFTVFILGAIPYALIGGLTRFQAEQSTLAQRLITMLWLASGVFIGASIPFFSLSFQEVIDILIWATDLLTFAALIMLIGVGFVLYVILDLLGTIIGILLFIPLVIVVFAVGLAILIVFAALYLIFGLPALIIGRLCSLLKTKDSKAKAKNDGSGAEKGDAGAGAENVDSKAAADSGAATDLGVASSGAGSGAEKGDAGAGAENVDSKAAADSGAAADPGVAGSGAGSVAELGVARSGAGSVAESSDSKTAADSVTGNDGDGSEAENVDSKATAHSGAGSGDVGSGAGNVNSKAGNVNSRAGNVDSETREIDCDTGNVDLRVEARNEDSSAGNIDPKNGAGAIAENSDSKGEAIDSRPGNDDSGAEVKNDNNKTKANGSGGEHIAKATGKFKAVAGGVLDFRAGFKKIFQLVEKDAWGKASDRAKAIVSVKAMSVLLFMCSLAFCATAIAGFVIVGQMLERYGSCTTLS